MAPSVAIHCDTNLNDGKDLDTLFIFVKHNAKCTMQNTNADHDTINLNGVLVELHSVLILRLVYKSMCVTVF